MEALTTPVLLLGLAMILAIIIERVIEIVKSLYLYLDARKDFSPWWTRRAERVRDRLETRLDYAKAGDQHQFDVFMSIASRYLSPSEPDQGSLISVSSDKIRTIIIRIVTKGIAIILGICFAYLFRIDVLQLVELSMMNPVPQNQYFPGHLGMILAGISMGLGAAPMHKIIMALEASRRLRKRGGGI